MNKLYKENGFSLLEIMVALSLGLVLIATLFLVFLQTKASYSSVIALATIQDNGRFAFAFMNNTIHQAKAILGYAQDHLPAILQKKSILHSDVLVARYLNFTKIYFVADTHRLNERGQKIYALYEKKYMPGVETMRRELISGVDSIQIRYGVAGQGASNPVNYVKANEVNNWQAVRCLMMDLYLNSIQPISTGLFPFIYADNSATYFDKDLRLHRRWSVPIFLQNRMLFAKQIYAKTH